MVDLGVTKNEVSSEIDNLISGVEQDLYRNKDNLSPMISITYFFVISLAYLFLQIFVIVRSESLIEIDKVKTHKLYLISYCLLILLGSFFINYNISKSLCPDSPINIYTLILHTLLPWLLIFGSIYGLLLIFDTWHRPFSNTLGYFVIKILQVERYFSKLLEPARDAISTKTEENEQLLQAILNIETNKNIFINELDEDPILYKQFMQQLKDAKIIKLLSENDGENNENEIYKLIVIKNSVGRFVWFFLAGIVISTITYNNMINSSCNISKESILKQYDNMV